MLSTALNSTLSRSLFIIPFVRPAKHSELPKPIVSVTARSWLTAVVTLLSTAFLVPKSTLVWVLITAFVFAVLLATTFQTFGVREDGGYDYFRPRFYLCWTMHARFYPLRYRFRYPLLYVGFPATSPAPRLPPLFSIDPARYYSPDLPFSRKLDSLLISHGLRPEDCPTTYVVTTPAFCGYSFNPVSYYHLYDANRTLRLTVLEVNNTYGESCMYILTPTPGLPVRKGYTYAGKLEKRLFISPYNPETGHYEIQVRDPVAGEEAKVDINMTVFDGCARKNMVARVQGDMGWETGRGSGLWITLAWGWRTWIAMPATFAEAGRLWWKGCRRWKRGKHGGC